MYCWHRRMQLCMWCGGVWSQREAVQLGLTNGEFDKLEVSSAVTLSQHVLKQMLFKLPNWVNAVV